VDGPPKTPLTGPGKVGGNEGYPDGGDGENRSSEDLPTPRASRHRHPDKEAIISTALTVVIGCRHNHCCRAASSDAARPVGRVGLPPEHSWRSLYSRSRPGRCGRAQAGRKPVGQAPDLCTDLCTRRGGTGRDGGDVQARRGHRASDEVSTATGDRARQQRRPSYCS
jgi:hypothetical protein